MSAETLIRNDAIQQALTELVRGHRTEFEGFVTQACVERGVRYDSDWLDRYYRGM
jgi:hypothetical protein